MNDEELTELLQDLVQAAVSISENVEVIARAIQRAENNYDEDE